MLITNSSLISDTGFDCYQKSRVDIELQKCQQLKLYFHLMAIPMLDMHWDYVLGMLTSNDFLKLHWQHRSKKKTEFNPVQYMVFVL